MEAKFDDNEKKTTFRIINVLKSVTDVIRRYTCKQLL